METKLTKADQLAMGLFLSLTIHQVLESQDKLGMIDAELLINQICKSITALFPESFEA